MHHICMIFEECNFLSFCGQFVMQRNVAVHVTQAKFCQLNFEDENFRATVASFNLIIHNHWGILESGCCLVVVVEAKHTFLFTLY